MGGYEISSIQGDLIDAAVGDINFVEAVQNIADHFGAGGSVIFELNRKTGVISDWVSPNLVSGNSGYDQHINSINPRMHYSLRHAPGHVNYEGRFINDRGIDRHEFYDWLRNSDGFRYFLGARIYDEGDISLFHSIEFDKRRSHPEPDEIEKFGRIARSVGNAWRLSKKSGQNYDADTLEPWTPEHLPWAVLAISSSGHLIQANTAGWKMLEAKEFLVLRDRAISAADRRSIKGFANMISACLSGEASEMLLLSDDRIPVTVQAFPTGATSAQEKIRPAGLIYIADTRYPREDATAAMSRLYKLSNAEKKLVLALSDGSHLSEAAEKLGITRNTARNQIQSVYGKTGTRRQQELLVRLLRLAGH